MRPPDFPGECIQVFVLPFRFVCILIFALSVASSFVKNEEHHLCFAILVPQCIDNLLASSILVHNSLEEEMGSCRPALHFTLQECFRITAMIGFYNSNVILFHILDTIHGRKPRITNHGLKFQDSDSVL